LTDTQLREKFGELARRAIGDSDAAQLFEKCLALEHVEDVAALRRHWAS
jgi:hypothetical protein